ncbi:hypothetical protein EJ110_NYTH09823 [Nymphaea thermarum]|nr:hypothetical protein EJ110_NYTH09823 [Nymphaea thermarum]
MKLILTCQIEEPLSLEMADVVPNPISLPAKSEDMVTAYFSGERGWEGSSKTVSVMKFFDNPLQGEYQDHCNTFIVEDDFSFIAKNGLNAVRIPVGSYWISKLHLILKVDGNTVGQEMAPLNLHKLKKPLTKPLALYFFSSRYANSPSLAAVEFLNEHRAPYVSPDALAQYYQAGYDAVRRHSSTAYVVLSNRLGSLKSPTELFALANGRSGTVIDVHYYNLFPSDFNNLSVQQNIDFNYQTRASELNIVTLANGLLSFVGMYFYIPLFFFSSLFCLRKKGNFCNLQSYIFCIWKGFMGERDGKFSRFLVERGQFS